MSVEPLARRLRPAAFALTRSRAGRLGATAAAVVAGLVALDLIGFVATVYFGAELLEAAEAAGVAELLPR
jgi:hypothetical protein